MTSEILMTPSKQTICDFEGVKKRGNRGCMTPKHFLTFLSFSFEYGVRTGRRYVDFATTDLDIHG
jgi:hypothetical protein